MKEEDVIDNSKIISSFKEETVLKYLKSIENNRYVLVEKIRYQFEVLSSDRQVMLFSALQNMIEHYNNLAIWYKERA